MGAHSNIYYNIVILFNRNVDTKMATNLKQIVKNFNRCRLLKCTLKKNIYPFYTYNFLNNRKVSRCNELWPISSCPYSSVTPIDCISDEDEVRYIDIKHEIHEMKFSELKEKAQNQYYEKGRNLVHVKLSGGKLPGNRHYKQPGILKQTPTFRLLQAGELEELVRKNKQYNKGQSFQLIAPTQFLTSSVNIDGTEKHLQDTNVASVKPGKINHKQLSLKVGIADHDIQTAIKRISKWLHGGTTFVTVSITTSGKKLDGKALEQNITKQLECVEGIGNLTIKILQ